MDPADLYRHSSEWAAAVFTGVTADQHADATPCSAWNVRELMAHIVGGNQLFAASALGTGSPDPNAAPEADILGADPAATYRAAASAVIEAFATPGAYERMVSVPAGEMPGVALYGIAMTEQLLHGWDLAKATGQETALDQDLAAAADAMIRPNIDSAVAGGFYGPALEVAAEASAADRLIALVGRQP